MFLKVKHAVKEAWNQGKKAIINTSAAVAVLAAGAVSAHAADPAIDTTQVTSTFTSMTTTVLVVIGAIAGSAVTIMGVILAWKYGRKLFGMLAR